MNGMKSSQQNVQGSVENIFNLSDVSLTFIMQRDSGIDVCCVNCLMSIEGTVSMVWGFVARR